jgi:hypothetical protein
MKILSCIIGIAALISIPVTAQENFPISDGGLKVPSSWRLVSVTKGHEFDEGTGYTLWFQDAAGSVYVVPAFEHQAGNFTFAGEIKKFPVTTNSFPQRVASQK